MRHGAVGAGEWSRHGTPAMVLSGTPVIHTLCELFTESVDIRASPEAIMRRI